MQYSQQRGLAGYFTKEDYVYAQMMEPNERWTVDQAEHRLYALLEDGIVEEKTSTENLGGKATVLRITKKEEPASGDLTAITVGQLEEIIGSGLSFAKLVPAAGEWTLRDANTSENTFHLIEHSNLIDANTLCGVYGEWTKCLLNAYDEEQNYFLIADEMDNGITDEQWNEYRKQSAQDRDFNAPKPEPPKPTKIPTMLWTRCNCVSFGNMKLCQQCMSKFTSSGDLEK
jgi:hypothetical protein